MGTKRSIQAKVRRVGAAMVVAGFVLAGAGVSLPSASADHANARIDICHATNSVKNPYVTFTTNESSVDGLGNGDHYLEHGGGLWSPVAPRGTWGDIIPPVEGHHGGLNWTPDGQAIYNNDCTIPGQNPPGPTPVARAVECQGAQGAPGITVTLVNGSNAPAEFTVEQDGVEVAGSRFTVAAAGAEDVSLPQVEDVATTIRVTSVGYLGTFQFASNCSTPQPGCVVNCGSITITPDPPPPAECVSTAENNQCTPCPDDAPVPDGTGFCGEEDLILPAAGSPPATVGGVVVTQPAPQALPRTGSEAVALLQIGLGLIVMGAGAMLFGRDRLALI